MPKIKKKIFITGSSKGIGFGLAKKFSDLDFDVLINSSNTNNLKKASKKLNNCKYYLGDITSEKNIKNISKKIRNDFGKIDYLICNYGEGNFKKNNLDFKNSFEKNFFSTVNTIKHILPLLKKDSKIICISSICGLEILEGAPLGYSLAKSALNNYVKGVSFILAKKQITINSLALGNIYFEGSVWQKKIKLNKNKVKRYIKKNVPTELFGSIENVFDFCKFLIINDTKFITGTTSVIDGGQTRKL